MFTLAAACKYLGISRADLDQHLSLSDGKGYVFKNSDGEQVLHDGDIERVQMRMSYAKQLAKEKAAVMNQGIASIDL